MSVTDITELYNYHKQRQGIGMENQFIRHEPCFERILFVLTLDRKKMKERILIGEEQQIRFRLNGSQNTEVLCDMTRPLGTFLINFERDTDRLELIRAFSAAASSPLQPMETAGAGAGGKRISLGEIS